MVFLTILNFSNPLPFGIPDQGHRTFDVGDREGHDVALHILEEFGGMKVRTQFHVCGTHQTQMMDNTTVLMYFDKGTGLSGDGISRAVDNPMEKAEMTKAFLLKNGYTAEIQEITCKELPPNNLVVVITDNLNGGAFVYRKSIPFGGMPRPPSGLE